MAGLPSHCRVHVCSGLTEASSAVHGRVLADGISTKAMALMLEAFFSAKTISANPQAARGGPWARPTLSEAQLGHCQAMGKLSLRQFSLACRDSRSRALRAHLDDLCYGSSVGAPRGCEIYKGIFVARRRRSGRSGRSGKSGRSGRSGKCGYLGRQARIKAGTLKQGSKEHVRLHRGKCPRARRAAEHQARVMKLA